MTPTGVPYLPEYGIAIFSIGAIIYTIRLFMGFLKNHVQHNIEVHQKQIDALHELMNYLRRS